MSDQFRKSSRYLLGKLYDLACLCRLDSKDIDLFERIRKNVTRWDREANTTEHYRYFQFRWMTREGQKIWMDVDDLKAMFPHIEHDVRDAILELLHMLEQYNGVHKGEMKFEFDRGVTLFVKISR